MGHMFHILQPSFSSTLSWVSEIVCITSFGRNAESLNVSPVDCEASQAQQLPGWKSQCYSPRHLFMGAHEVEHIIPWPPGWKPVLSGWACCFKAVHSWVTHLGNHFSVFKALLLFNLLFLSHLMQHLSTAWAPCCWTFTAYFSLSSGGFWLPIT